jgi:cellulose synthase/poly-beta-1,6-N-acetylglucosamine synthase-like glycosyltransferase
MAALLSVLLVVAAGAVVLPALILFVECALALMAREPPAPMSGARPSVAVLVPAHDEAAVIESTVRALAAELLPADRLLVVADNCTDQTASLARGAGATVVQRDEPVRRGKGFALGYGVEYLRTQPPEVLVVVDADCTLAPGSLQSLALRVAAESRPVQAMNTIRVGPDARPLEAVSAFAFLVKNVVRPRGLARLGMPCPLMGTGMAFPWAVVADARLATSALAEDLQLGLDLTLAGHPPLLCLEARVSSPAPSQARARSQQRRRWEHGHLLALLRNAPRLLVAAVQRLDLGLAVMALDLCVPPLSLLVLASLAVFVVGGAAVALGRSWTAALLAGFALTLVLTSVVAAWARFGREEFRFTTLLAAPLYAIGKIPMYLGFVGRRQRDWVRTERESDREERTPSETRSS